MTERIYTNISAISKFMSNDIPIGIKDYAVRKINELLNLIYDAMDADTELVTANKDNLILRCIADCVAYTIRDLHYTKIPIIHWESIIEKMYLLVFDEIKKCSKKQYDSETTLAFINYSYNKAMQEILNEFVDENEESIQVLKQELIYQKRSVIDEYYPLILETLINNEEYVEVANFIKDDVEHVCDVNELLEQGKVREENYNKLLENPEYKKYKEKYEKELLDVLEEIQKEIRNPFYWIKEFILYTAIYPIMRFINRFRKESKK